MTVLDIAVKALEDIYGSLQSSMFAARTACEALADIKQEQALQALVDEAQDLGEYSAPDIARLLKFYGAANLEELTRAQAGHIERLQAKLPPIPSLVPTFPRG